MKHARSDYDCIQAPGLIPDDEPVFLIRGQDLAAIPAAEAWCEAALELGAGRDLIAAVRRHIEAVRLWQQSHAKVPDAPQEVLDFDGELDGGQADG